MCASEQDDLTPVNLTANLTTPSGAWEPGLFVDYDLPRLVLEVVGQMQSLSDRGMDTPQAIGG